MSKTNNAVDFTVEDLKDLDKQTKINLSEYKSKRELEVMEEGAVAVSESDLVFKPSLELMSKTGLIDENNYFLYDTTTEKFVFIRMKTGKVSYFTEKGALRSLTAYCEKAGMDLEPLEAKKGYINEHGFEVKGRSKSSVLNFVKTVSSKFSPNDEVVWTEGLEDYFNEFIEKITMLEKVRNFSKSEDKFKNLDFLKAKAPKFYALLMNLLEYNETYVLIFINYISTFAVTRKKVPLAYLFAGVEGSGKGVLLMILKMIFGKEYVADVLAERLNSDFQGILKNKLIVNFNEVSTDFTKKDSSYQKLKVYITEEDFELNRKHISEVTTNNDFIVLLSTNEPHALKITETDRRFNYFKQERTLKDVALKDFDIDIEDFVLGVKEEINEIVEFIGRFDYNSKEAKKIVYSENRLLNIQITENASKILFSQIKKMNFEYIQTEFENQVENISVEDKDKMSMDTVLQLNNVPYFLAGIEEGFEKGVIPTMHLQVLMEVVLGERYDRNQRTKKFKEHGLTKTKSTRINGTPTSCKVIK